MLVLDGTRQGRPGGARGWEYYRKCPRCGAEYGTEKEYIEQTQMTLFSSIHYGICSCGWDMERRCDKNTLEPVAVG